MPLPPFTLAVPQQEVDDLKKRLQYTRWPEQLPPPDWSRGVPVGYLHELVDYWCNAFDWRKQEAELNAFPQFITPIDGQDIHFLHVRSDDPDALPLLLCHGYPGSVVDFLRIIGPLTRPTEKNAPSFHVVAPSLPGLGLSPAVKQTGWTLMRTAHAFAGLMEQLGYERYGIQAGDAGAGIASLLGVFYPHRLVGIHLNGPAPFPEPTPEALRGLEQSEALSGQDQFRLGRLNAFMREGRGYVGIQSTRPFTIGYGLHDSPVMQLAWIVEKYHEWTDPAKKLPQEAMDIDQLLTNVSVYWFTGNGAGGANFIYENMYPAPAGGDWTAGENQGEAPAQTQKPVPMGVAVFAGDYTIRKLVDPAGTIAHWSEFASGGHFAAMEAPELLIADIRNFFGSFA
jgi:pimeloyl-ACP methyl ester carboxylesterase